MIGTLCSARARLWLCLFCFLEISTQCYGQGELGESEFGSESDYYSMHYEMPGVNQSMMDGIFRAANQEVMYDAAGQAMAAPFGYRPGNPTRDHGCRTVTRVPQHLRSSGHMKPRGLGNFYQKYTHAYGIPVLASNQVSDNALMRACYTTRFLFAGHSRVRYYFYKYSGRVALIGRREGTNWIPEHSNLPAWWNTRARGLGATTHAPVSTGGEENVLCLNEDRYRAQDIFLHESAHGVHLLGAVYGIRGFDNRLRAHYDYCRRTGKWANTYSMSTKQELFAESTQAYFNVQSYAARPDGVRGPINTRTKLYQYDPVIYRMVQEVFPCNNEYIKRCGSTRAQENAQVLNMDCDLGDGTGTTGGGGGGTGGSRTTAGPVTGGACTDSNTNCASWAQRGECTANPDWMRSNCRKSCNTCPATAAPTTARPVTAAPVTTVVTNNPTTSGPTEAPTSSGPTEAQTSTEKPPDPVTEGTCSDKEANCGYWSTSGYCTNASYRAFMTANCKKSCNLCTGTGATCSDKNQHCRSWASQGECDRNPTYMNDNCQKSCDQC